jgi:hypothetical protein
LENVLMSPRLRRRSLLAAAGAAGMAIRGRTAAAQANWDAQPETRPTADVLPAAMLSGPHYTLGPTVITANYLNAYTATSDFGDFTAPSDTRLRRLIREIAAIAELKQITQTDAFAEAAKEAAKSPIRSAKNLIDDPVKTLSAIPEGIGSLFNRVNEQIDRSGRSNYEDGKAKAVLAVSGFKRDYAAKLGIDVYSTNKVLQQELDRVAWAATLGNMTLGALSIATGAIVLQVASNVRLLEQARNVVESTPPSELSIRNRDQLRRMQVPNPVIDGFLQNHMLSPRHQTLIVAGLAALGDIPGRADFIAYATQTKTEDEALLIQQMAELLASYNASVAPVRQIKIFVNLPVAYTAKSTAVLLLPIDRLPWSERTAALAGRIAKDLPKPRPVSSTEIWITGDASPLAQAGMKKQGLGLSVQCGQRLPLLD